MSDPLSVVQVEVQPDGTRMVVFSDGKVYYSIPPARMIEVEPCRHSGDRPWVALAVLTVLFVVLTVFVGALGLMIWR